MARCIVNDTSPRAKLFVVFEGLFSISRDSTADIFALDAEYGV